MFFQLQRSIFRTYAKSVLLREAAARNMPVNFHQFPSKVLSFFLFYLYNQSVRFSINVHPGDPGFNKTKQKKKDVIK